MLQQLRQRLDRVGRPFSSLLFSDALMLLAIMVGHIAMPWWVAHRGGAAHLAIFAVVGAVASVLTMLLLSPLGDRHAKGNLISVSLLVLAGQALLLALLASLDLYHLPLILLLQVLGAAATAVMTPASLSIVAELVSSERIADALALKKSAQAIGRLIGPVLGGALLAAAGTAPALWLHCALLLGAALLARRIPRQARPPGDQKSASWLSELRMGVLVKWKIPLERGWTLVNFVVCICFMPAVGMLLPLKVQSLHLSAAWLGACEAALSVGLLAGALGISAQIAHHIGRYPARLGGLLVQGAALALAGWLSQPHILVLMFFVVGVGLSLVQLVGQTHRLLAIPDDYRGRMTAVNMMTIQVANSLGPALAGIALLHFGVAEVYMAAGIGVLLCTAGYLLVPGYAQFLALDHDAVSNWYGRNYPELFQQPGIQRGGQGLSE
ncbi:MFS transporter [Chitinimonas sp.]|uniref:MFS transporter n=1 Tax=Chitinimonas sp. TaxID=1934313 RepID=UPI0035AE1041